MSKYRVTEDSGASEIIDAASLDEAMAIAERWASAGEYDERVLVSYRVESLDNPDESDSGEIEAGPEPAAPDCNDNAPHDWQSPYEVVGGARENPGVWSTGGTAIASTYVCSRCGVYMREHRAGQRNPGELAVRISYSPADERSLAWARGEREE